MIASYIWLNHQQLQQYPPFVELSII